MSFCMFNVEKQDFFFSRATISFHMIDTFEDEPEYERPNKSEQKREVQVFLDLAKKLETLSEQQWYDIALPEQVIDALQTLKEMPQKGAKKRQFKLIAKYLRDIDVHAALLEIENVEQVKTKVNLEFHRVERWRDRLLSEGAPALTAFLAEYSDVNVQQLRQLIRNANQEANKNKPPKSAKLLFKLLREWVK
ncbi:ribosome biogenesis factor YjgA [Ghiorsea bivora]|uniref:ribosome biogenesis factor YjgA n=1 Tax=Ghiorsea bivora TaxID=1485545 RepID=UPI00068964C5|nr:ribosome biogenesis factor YjgA [Ghiorsea bivora]